MAAGLLQRIVTEADSTADWHIDSAGTWAIDDLPPTALASVTLKDRGIDLSHHRSRMITRDALRAAQVILVMTRHHLEAICAEFPEVADRTMLLSQLTGQMFDIDDPYEGTVDDYRRCANDIERILRDGLPRLIDLADHTHRLAA
jgi:protein-tyrosine-phosphatase